MASPVADFYVTSNANAFVGMVAPFILPPSGSFIGAPTSGTVPLGVTFTDQSTGNISSWSWTFGDGGTSISQNPTHAYITAGTYDVSLTVTGAGGSNTFTRTAYVTGTPIIGSPLTSFTLTSPTTQSTAPFSLGHAFKQGDIPSGSAPVITGANTQTVIKNSWPDGSVKFAIISGTASLTANTPLSVSVASGSLIGGTALTTTDLQSTGFAATFNCGSFGSVTFSGSGLATPFQTWVSGPRMSSWIYRSPVGSDTFLVVWMEVKLYAGGAVEVLPWIENGYLRVTGPIAKSDTYSFTLGGTQRFSQAINLNAQTRTPLISGTILSHWLGTDPQVVPLHDPAYLQSTEVVPSYGSVMVAGSAAVLALPSSFTPLQAGTFNYDGDNMASTGYQEPIGLLPQHDVLYLVANQSDRSVVYKNIVRSIYSGGRYPTHYRDETTNRPFRFSAYPTLVAYGGASSTSTYTPAPAGGNTAPGWDVAHHPSIGYIGYLVTGLWYAMEEIVFVATFNHLIKTDIAVMRNGAAGLVQSCYGGWQTRACAWQLRTLAQAVSMQISISTTLSMLYKLVILGVGSNQANLTRQRV
jgi:PKD repeat protein